MCAELKRGIFTTIIRANMRSQYVVIPKKFGVVGGTLVKFRAGYADHTISWKFVSIRQVNNRGTSYSVTIPIQWGFDVGDIVFCSIEPLTSREGAGGLYAGDGSGRLIVMDDMCDENDEDNDDWLD